MKHALYIVVGAAGMLLLSGCEDKNANSNSGKQSTPNNPTSIYGKSAKMGKDVKGMIEQSDEQTKQAAMSQTGEGKFAEIAGMKWAIPENWENVGPSGMRAAEYKVGGVSIRFFTAGGTADQNINRWKGQVKDPIDGPSTKTVMAGTVKCSIVAMTGTYSGMGPGGAPTPPASNTGFLGAHIDGAAQPVQVVVTGPADEVDAMRKAWETMLAGIQAK